MCFGYAQQPACSVSEVEMNMEMENLKVKTVNFSDLIVDRTKEGVKLEKEENRA